MLRAISVAGATRPASWATGETGYRTDHGVVSAEPQPGEHLGGVAGEQADDHHVAVVHDLLVVSGHPHRGQPGRELGRPFRIPRGEHHLWRLNHPVAQPSDDRRRDRADSKDAVSGHRTTFDPTTYAGRAVQSLNGRR